MRKALLISLFIFVLSIQRLVAQDFFFRQYGVKEGLSQSNVNCGIQDNKGFYWLGTDGGLSRFDGVEFKNFTTQDGLAENNAASLCFDDSLGILVGHQNGGFSLVGKNGKIRAIKGIETKSKISSIIKNGEHTFWISTLGDGAIRLRFDKSMKLQSQDKFMAKDGLSDYIFHSFRKGEKAWFITDFGVKIFDSKTNKIEFFKINQLPPYQITTALLSSQNTLWVGTYNGGLYEYDLKTETITRKFTTENGLSGNWISAIYEDEKSNIWVGTWGGGLTQISKNKTQIYSTSNNFSDDKVRFIMQDNEGTLVFGTNEHGIAVYTNSPFVKYSTNQELENEQIWALVQDKDKVICGTNKGIAILDLKTNTFQQIKNFDFPVRALSKIGQDVYIGTWGNGLYKISLNSFNVSKIVETEFKISQNINSLFVDSKDNLFIGTIKGFSKYNKYNNSLESYPGIIGKIELDVVKIYGDKSGNIWLGTKRDGLVKFDGKSFVRIAENEIVSSATSISEDAGGNIIVGTEGSGVFKIGVNGKIQNYSAENGLASDFITALACNGDEIWVCNNKGLNIINSQNNKTLLYDAEDGFTSIETKLNAIQISEHKIWFGTVDGLISFDKKYEQRIPKNNIQINRIKLNLKDTLLVSGMKYNHKQNSFVFEYTLSSLLSPMKTVYWVKLDGWDEDWKMTKERIINYANLPTGEYNLMIKKDLNDENQYSFKFSILPPFYKTWWFYSIIIYIIIFSIYVFVKVREKKLRAEKRVLAQKVAERTAEVVQKNEELQKAYKDIKDSIVYAQRIQQAILPTDGFIKESFPQSFVFFKPRDIVSGDFYWMEKTEKEILFAAVDCTGHGVPGAFVSMVGHNLLNQSVRKHRLTKPSDILDDLHSEVKKTLQNSTDSSVKDGMDLALCNYNPRTMTLQYAGANNSLYHIRNGILTEYKASKFAIGYKGNAEGNLFENNTIQIEKGDRIYIFTDGYSDQFGGEEGRKFMSKKFKELLTNICAKPFNEQQKTLSENIISWMKAKYKQIDDMLIIGIGFD